MVVRGFRPDGATTVSQHVLTPPRRVLTGARIGVLDNMKPNAGLLMTTVAENLAARGPGPAPLVRAKNAALPCPDDILAEMIAGADLVLTGSAD